MGLRMGVLPHQINDVQQGRDGFLMNETFPGGIEACGASGAVPFGQPDGNPPPTRTGTDPLLQAAVFMSNGIPQLPLNSPSPRPSQEPSPQQETSFGTPTEASPHMTNLGMSMRILPHIPTSPSPLRDASYSGQQTSQVLRQGQLQSGWLPSPMTMQAGFPQPNSPRDARQFEIVGLQIQKTPSRTVETLKEGLGLLEKDMGASSPTEKVNLALPITLYPSSLPLQTFPNIPTAGADMPREQAPNAQIQQNLPSGKKRNREFLKGEVIAGEHKILQRTKSSSPEPKRRRITLVPAPFIPPLPSPGQQQQGTSGVRPLGMQLGAGWMPGGKPGAGGTQDPGLNEVQDTGAGPNITPLGLMAHGGLAPHGPSPIALGMQQEGQGGRFGIVPPMGSELAGTILAQRPQTPSGILPCIGGLRDKGSQMGGQRAAVPIESLIEMFSMQLRTFDTLIKKPRVTRHSQEVLNVLATKTLVAAELHSAERLPQPRCHPGTRVNLIKRIHDWLVDEGREQNILWLSGPAGIGKSAVAQTVGELAEELGIFGAAVFFSRSRKVVDLSLLATSIISQLIAKDDTCRRLVTDFLLSNPRILDPDQQTELEKLLISPFWALRNPLERLIIIDGVDECQGDEKQLELVRLVTKAVTARHPPPFLWIICSRPEYHLKELFRNETLSKICLQVDLLPQEPGAEADIESYLIDGLERILQQYHGRHGPDSTLPVVKGSWELKELVHAARGVFVVATSILGFVGDPIVANPHTQLQIVLNTINGSSTDEDSSNFLAPIDALYIGVLAGLKKDQRHKTLQLLGICAISPPIPALHLANLLGITQVAFYSALQTLHAFLSVPHHTGASYETLHFFHASFPDFLTHRARSGKYFQDSDVHRLTLVEVLFHALDSTCFAYSKRLSWLPSGPDRDEDDSESPLSIAYDTLDFAAIHTWELCTSISSPRDHVPLFETLANFDFRRLRLFNEAIPVQPFVEFVRWLFPLESQIPELVYIVRRDACYSEDKELSAKHPSFHPLHLYPLAETDELRGCPRNVFIGLAEKTILVLLVSEAVIIYSMEDIDGL